MEENHKASDNKKPSFLKSAVKKLRSYLLRGRLLCILGKLTGQYKPIVFNVNKTNYNKKCLLVYIASPFVKGLSDSHQNIMQVVEMAHVIGTFGYDVDVADYANSYALKCIKRKYDLIIDIQTLRAPGFWSKNMNEGCKTVIYSTGSSVVFAWENERKRMDDLEKRRRVRVPQRMSGGSKPGREAIIEEANAFWHIGNEFNVHTYDYLNLPPVSFIKNSGYKFGWLKQDIVRDKRNFLFLASSGQVLKGLDLLLEIFGRENFPCNLYVCSLFTSEEDFCEVYRHELFERPNIFPVGFVDINGENFRKITEKCAYMIMPSCSEGCAGSVLTAMSAGLVPIISNVCGIDGEGAVILPDCNIDTIERYIREYSAKPDEWIKERSAQCVKDIEDLYTMDSFRQSVHDAMSALLG